MSQTVPTAFVTQYDSETKLVYQRSGPKLQNIFRTTRGVRGDTFRWNLLGQGVANSKGRGADLVPMNLQHTGPSATLTDDYAPDYLDDLDIIKMHADTRNDYSRAASMAIGRKYDEKVIDALEGAAAAGGAANTILEAGFGLTIDKVKQASEILDEQNVPEEDRIAIISPQSKTDVLGFEEATSMEFTDGRFLKAGQITTTWMGFTWIMHTGLPIAGTTRSNFFAHRDAIGVAIGRDITSVIQWVPQKQSHLIVSMQSMGTTFIEFEGVVEVETDES